MMPELYQRMRGVFDGAMELPETERLSFVETQCAQDAEAGGLAVRLLRAYQKASSFLEIDPVDDRRLGPYLIAEELGRGAMGVVYAATDTRIHRKIALKVIHLDSFTDRSRAALLSERLFREARIAGTLFHPGIVTIFEANESDGKAWIAMERVLGPSLRDVLQPGVALERDLALDILRQIASALDYANDKHVVHRDVKPANILLQDGKVAKIADFGIAKIISTEEQSRTSLGLGTPSYMSPEQVEGKPANGQADQFSLAVIAFEMLTGSKPFEADSPSALMFSIAHGARPSAHAKNRALPSRIDGVFHRAFRKRPEERYATSSEFVEALASALGMVYVVVPRRTTTKPRGAAIHFLVGALSIAAALILGALAFRSTGFVVRHFSVQQSTLTSTNHPIDLTTFNSSASIHPGDLFSQALAMLNAGNPRTALALLNKAADAGDTKSMLELAELYSAGTAIDRNDAQAIRWYREAADAGNTQGMLQLGGMYSLGIDVSQNYREAAHWFQMAADAGNSSAMFDLGWLYEKGEGVPKNLNLADKLYRQAATLGNDEAKRRLALRSRRAEK